MSLYAPQGISDEIRAAMGEAVMPAEPRFIFESVMPVGYISEQMGMRVESSVATPRVQQGEFLTTAKGDFVIVEYTTTNSAGETITAEVVQVDVGQGAEQLQTVGYVDEGVPPPEQSFYSESAISTNPYETQLVEYYTQPDAPQAEVVDFTVGTSAPVVTGGYEYYSSGTASATADLIAYGETDVGGNPVPVYDPYYQDNLAAAYDGI